MRIAKNKASPTLRLPDVERYSLANTLDTTLIMAADTISG